MNDTVKILKTEIDKIGQEVVVKYCNRVGQGPGQLMSFYYRQKADLIDDGFSGSEVGITNSCQAVYLEIDSIVVGHILFELFKDEYRTFIVLSAVAKEYRNRGLYKIMHYAYEDISRELGARVISSLIHVNNTVRLKTAESVGFMPQYYRMRKVL